MILSTLRKSLLLLACAPLLLSAQTSLQLPQAPHHAPGHSVEQCGFDPIHQQLMQEDAGYQERTLAFEELARNAGPFVRSLSTYKVPVVVHVMETGTGLTSLTEGQIRNAIRAMNERFRKVAGTPGFGTGVDVGMEFVLAVRDPNGNCTNGITRTSMTGNATYMASGVFRNSIGISDASLKSTIVWDQTRYLNIWAVSEIDNNNGGTGVAGYAQFASSHGTSGDGIVLIANYLRDPTSGTLTHEMGHVMNAYHTFEGDANGTACPPNATCASQGDLVCDTPPHIRSNSDCNLSGTNSCDGGSSNALYARNYMDYSSDACQNMFTAGQASRMVAALTGPRASFLAANGNMALVPVGTPVMDIISTTAATCGIGQSITLYDNSLCIPNTGLPDSEFPSISFSWTLTNGVNTYNSTAQNPTFTLGSAGTYNATLTTTTALGTSSRTENGIVIVAAAPVAACTPGSFNPAGNYGLTVSRVRFNTFDNCTNGNVNGVYQNFTCTHSTVVARNGTYPLSVIVNGSATNGTEVFEAYIDYNNNGAFENPSELIGSGSAALPGGLVNANVTIPNTAVLNTMLRMRVYGEYQLLEANERNCSVIMDLGDVEDYGVYVSGSLAAVSIAASPSTTITYGTNVTFTPTPTNGGASPTYQWFRNGSPVATGATWSSTTLLPGDQIHCLMSSNLAGVLASPATSNTLTMTVTGPPLSEFVASPLRICAGSSVTFTDQSLLAPTSWSWTFTGGTPATSSSQNPVITYSTAGTYSVTLVASNGSGTGTTMTKTGYITVLAAPTAGCVVTRTNTPAGSVGIQNVTLNTINNSTAFNDAVMMNFGCTHITTLSPNTPYPISVLVSSANNQWVRAYIDYNRDGDFVDAGETVFSPANGQGVRSGSFTTPAAPLTGLLMRMRVISDFTNTTPGPCTTPLEYGQVEEYGVIFPATSNTAPILSAAATPVLGSVAEDAGAPSGAVGSLISSLVDFASPSGQVDNVTDPDAGALLGMAVVAADATNGTWHYSINAGTNWNALGTPSAAAARLLAADANTRLYFQPNANFNGIVSSAITFRAWDRTTGTNGSTADVSTNGGATAYSSATDVASLTVTAVNDAPSATNLSAGETYTEDVNLNLIDIVVTDVDNGNITATLTMSNTAAGSLSTGTSGAVTSTYVAGTGVWTASGAIANVNTLLAGVTFIPASNFNSNFTIATSVSDAIAAAVTGTKAMTGTALNDPPQATNLSASETYTEDVSLNVIDIVVSDVDNANLTVTLTLSNTAAGALSTATSGAVTSTYVAGTGVWTASGAIANVNTLLAGVTFIPASNFNSNFTIATSVSDGIAAAVTGSKPMTVAAVNDAPVITSTPSSIATEDVLYTYNATSADIDGPGALWTLLPAHTCGGSISPTTGAFSFTPTGPVPPSSCTLAVQVCDTGSPDQCATQTTTITIGAVNDAPVITSTPSATATEDVAYTYNATRSDADGPGVTWTLLPAHTCGGSINPTTGVFGFTPAGPIPPSTCTLAVQACDNGTPDLCTTQTTMITINAVNDTPVITSTPSATATENLVYTYNATRSDADGPGATWSLLPAHTCGGSIVPSTGVFTFTPAGPTPPPTCTLALRVCDGGAPDLCNSQTATITITDVPTTPANCGGPYGPVCSNAGLIALTGTPSGGAWSGVGVSGNSFDPSAGTQTLTYTFTDANGSSNCNTTITVNTAATWYSDTDGDGFGDPGTGVLTCTPAMGAVSNNGDGCINDPAKQTPGVCGCGVADVPQTYYADTDGDGFGAGPAIPGFTCAPPANTVTNNTDGCANDPLKQAPGVCGCGVADVAATYYADTDGDGFGAGPAIPGFTCAPPANTVTNNTDGCANDPLKQAPGTCGCGVADVPQTYYADTDGDGFGAGPAIPGFTCAPPANAVTNNTDGCPSDPLKQAAGVCGCGVADVAQTYYADTDGDGFGAGVAIPGFTCAPPANTVTNNTDGCPADPLKQAPGNCGCGIPEGNCMDCLGVPNGPATIGSGCDDGNACTINDAYDASCDCTGQFIDSDGDLTADICDGCPSDPSKTSAGVCGCGVADVAVSYYADTDGDGFGAGPAIPGFTCAPPANTVTNNTDGCANDPLKQAPGACGCGVADVAATYYADADGDGFGAGPAIPGFTCAPPANTVTNNTDGCANDPLKQTPGACGCGVADVDSDNDGFADCIDTCPNETGQIGSPCDADPGPAVVPGQLDNTCTCVTTCLSSVTVELRTDAQSIQASWEILAQNTSTVLCQYSVLMNNITNPITEICCLPDGCYRLRVLDSGGDGFVSGGITGGYQLRESGVSGRRIIDNFGNFTAGGTSALASNLDNGAFCIPVSADKPIFASCDKLDWVYNQFIVASANPAVSAHYPGGGTNAMLADDGYEFWFFNPNGGFSYRRFRSHATSDGTGTGATRACHFKLLTSQLPQNVLLNVRIRARLDGVNGGFGPACRFKIDPTTAACPYVMLQDNPAFPSDLSCGVSRVFGGANSSANKIVAKPPQFSPAVASGNVRFQFRFRVPGEVPLGGGAGPSCIVRPPQSSPTLYLNWTSGVKLKCNTQYEVDVRVSKDGGLTWCIGGATNNAANCAQSVTPWGTICSVNITTSTYCPQTLQGGGSALSLAAEGSMTLYPNPNQGGQLFLELNNVALDATTASVDVFEMTGKRMMARTVPVQDGSLKASLELEGALVTGLYLVNITVGGRTYTERLVITP